MNQEQNNYNVQGNNISNNQNIQPNMYYTQQPNNKNKKSIVKFLIIIGGIILAVIILFIIIFSIVSTNSKKLNCKSNLGNITIMYNDKTITGYTATGLTYDLEGQKKYAEKIGIDSYIQEFTIWFENNTDGSCTYENK